ncbi:MAG TPA: DNA-binding domain-containing protein [Thermoanaerobaculia bacterium]|jgi:hypothetical protein|nr:DNA-binding domain-containing protein [Thermoanaerobaculia bacterium]
MSRRPPDRQEQEPALDVVQSWFQAVISHPDGVESGISAEEAQSLIGLGRDELERIVRRSRTLTASERIGIYAHAYYARLLECLGECFPVLRRLLGAELFEPIAFEYLQRYPSKSYTLDRLGDRFAQFLEETRSAEAGEAPAWPEMLADLARFEHAIARVFDGPGLEGEPPFSVEGLQALGAEGLASARLIPAPSLRLLTFRFPLNDLYTAARQAGEEDELDFPTPGIEHVTLCRRDFVVRRYPLSPLEHALLDAIVGGATVGEALAVAAEYAPPEENLSGLIERSFAAWTAADFFRGVVSPEGA